MTRRGFLLGAAAGLVAGGGLTWAGQQVWQRLQSKLGPIFVTDHTRAETPPIQGMPGRFPGRVIEVTDPAVVRTDWTIDAGRVNQMIDQGMKELTGADAADDAWRSLFQPGDVVGLKVNPTGRRPFPGEWGRHPHAVGAISNPEVLLKVVNSLKSVGIKPRDIILFDRYADEFCAAGYADLLKERDMEGVRWYGCSANGGGPQVDIMGFDTGRDSCSPELARQVVGYDPDVFVYMGFANLGHDPKDDRRFRSHLSMIVTRMVNKIINLPVLKDHASAGVTLALKNMSHGMNNNVARSHLAGIAHGWAGEGGVSEAGPNQCNTFIPTALMHRPLRQKMTLHILDGLIGVYEGGPANWNKSWGVWPHKGLLFATDPVALDHVGWDLIEGQRTREGWPSVGLMGATYQGPGQEAREWLAPLAASHLSEALTLLAASQNRQGVRKSGGFDRRTPEHIILAGDLGLGVFDAQQIDYRRVRTSGEG